MTVKALVKNTKYGVREMMGRYGFLYDLLPFLKRNPWHKVSPDSDICIEGFPRSANSFFVSIFHTYNPVAQCAHHMHAPMQIIKAADYGVPCVVLIRNPIDAIASVLVVDRALSIELAIQSYINFYDRIWPVRKTVVIASFEEATQRPHHVIKKVNQRYGTSFQMEALRPSVRETIFGKLQAAQKAQNFPETLVAIPTKNKTQIKQDILPMLSQHSLLATAEQLYQQFLSG